jgi:hypothetical protein
MALKLHLKIDCFITTELKERQIDRIHALKKMVRVEFLPVQAVLAVEN